MMPSSFQSDPTDQAFAVRDLSVLFGPKAAVDHLNLDVPHGSIFGLVGPNGAGKTTMISAATGLLRPQSGSAWINEVNVWEEPVAAKAHFGLLIDGMPVFDRLTATEYLEFLGGLRSMAPDVVAQRSEELLRTLGLAEAKDKQIVDFSAGMTKKILLAGALLHAPRVLILDEPLEAVDPASGQLIQKILRNYARSGGTVLLSSHVMELVEGLCDHVAIINQGTVIASGTVDEVRGTGTLVEKFVELVGSTQLDDDSFGWLGGK